MTELSVPLLNRLVDRMLDHADPKADQNIWNLARAAAEVIHGIKHEQFVAAYGGPGPTADSQRVFVRWASGGTTEHQLSPTGRMRMNPVPLTFGGPPQPPPNQDLPHVQQNVDYAAALDEVERRLMLKAPQYTGDTAAKVDALAQDYQSASQSLERTRKQLRDIAHILSPKQPISLDKLVGVAEDLMRQYGHLATGVDQLRRELAEYRQSYQETTEEIRTALDPDGQFEDESLIVLARERMNQCAARGQELDRLRERIGTEVEANSAEMLRRVLGAGENETLGQAARRVADSEGSGWKQYRELNKRENNRFHQLNNKIREIVAAVDESESDDHYMPEQPTIDAVRRVVIRLVEVDRHPDGSRKSAQEILDVVQDDWDGTNELKPFSWERGA